jgi:hypothetical protein
MAADFTGYRDQEILTAKFDNSGSDEINRLIISGLKEDRKSLFGLQVLRTIGFILVVLGMLWLYMKNILKPLAVVLILASINIIDMMVVDSDYINSEKYHPKDDAAVQTAVPTSIDNEILKDKGIYRVYSLTPDRFSQSDVHVSTFHKAVGGYHPAKIRIYQDIIERYFYAGYDPHILNMLNTKYIVTQNQQNGQYSYSANPDAYGPVWFVKTVKTVKDDAEAINSLGSTNLKDTAVVLADDAKLVKQPVPDSASTITVSKYDNDEIEYTADCKGDQFAVFSEVYYPYGWNAYIDGQKTDYVRTDYVLRGLSIPSGKHIIKFVFEPSSVKKGLSLSFIGSILVVILVLGGFFMEWREQKKKSTIKPVQ